MRRLISVGLAAVLLLAIAPAVMGVFHGMLHSTSEASSSSLACSVKASCGAGEVGIFRMSSTSNAHAGTIDGSAYGNVVCCSGPAGLGTTCSGTHATALSLSATDNAHAAAATGYPTQVCLSTTEATATCTLASNCGSGQACLATISSSTNAHVADCGAGGYPIKVCCYAGAAIPVGGVAEPPDATRSVSGSSSPPYAALPGAAGAVVLLLMAGGWYARRRRQM